LSDGEGEGSLFFISGGMRGGCERKEERGTRSKTENKRERERERERGGEGEKPINHLGARQ